LLFFITPKFYIIMEIGIDSFAKISSTDITSAHDEPVVVMDRLLERIAYADQAGLDVFGIGEHHRKEFLDSAPTIILAAAAAKTKRIRLTSAVHCRRSAGPPRSSSRGSR